MHSHALRAKNLGVEWRLDPPLPDSLLALDEYKRISHAGLTGETLPLHSLTSKKTKKKRTLV